MMSAARGSRVMGMVTKRYASKKAGGSTANGRDSNPKYLGQKVTPGQFVRAGNILRRQRGTQLHGGEHVGVGKDHTLYAKQDGVLRIGVNEKGKRALYIEPLTYQILWQKQRTPRSYRHDLEQISPLLLSE